MFAVERLFPALRSASEIHHKEGETAQNFSAVDVAGQLVFVCKRFHFYFLLYCICVLTYSYNDKTNTVLVSGEKWSYPKEICGFPYLFAFLTILTDLTAHFANRRRTARGTDFVFVVIESFHVNRALGWGSARLPRWIRLLRSEWHDDGFTG